MYRGIIKTKAGEDNTCNIFYNIHCCDYEIEQSIDSIKSFGFKGIRMMVSAPSGDGYDIFLHFIINADEPVRFITRQLNRILYRDDVMPFLVTKTVKHITRVCDRI